MLFCGYTNAQVHVYQTMRHFDVIGKDSVQLSFNENFELTPDNCGQSTRYAHINTRLNRFVGQFKDVSRLDPAIVMAEGAYNARGEKQGPFVTRYVNGQLQAKGDFVNDNFDGKWQLYYDNGKPELFFEAHGTDVTITDYWDLKGKKLVDNGKGKYIVTSHHIAWEGRLLNGKPDGTWHSYPTNDASKTTLETEKYKAGVFEKGESSKGKYTSPRLALVNTDLLPFVAAEKLIISPGGCNPTPNSTGVQYAGSWDSYERTLNYIVGDALKRFDLSRESLELHINGEVDEQGLLTDLTSYSAYNPQLANAIISTLKSAPRLIPATKDGRKVRQQIRFNFTFGQGRYNYNYQFGDLVDRSTATTASAKAK